MTATALEIIQLLETVGEQLNDIEQFRISLENRIRTLTAPKGQWVTKDGVDLGFGLPKDHYMVAQLDLHLAHIEDEERELTKLLEKLMKQHLLGKWAKAQRGVGLKQFARLLGSIGSDLHWHPLHERPRGVRELWAYCGLHNDSNGVAVRRQKGIQSNWSTTAKMRAWNVANSAVKQRDVRDHPKSDEGGTVTTVHTADCRCGTYRKVYDARRAVTFEKKHDFACIRCGPSGKPAEPGSLWRNGHKHADALRVVSKQILKDAWAESRRLAGFVD